MVQQMQSTRAALLVCMGLALAACGGGDRPAPQAAAAATDRAQAPAVAEVDQCSLLTPQEVAETLGLPVGPMEPIVDGPRPGCVYTTGEQARWAIFVTTIRFDGSELTPDSYRASDEQERATFEAEGLEYIAPEYLDGPGVATAWRRNWSFTRLEAMVPGYEVRILDYGVGEQIFTKQRARVLMEKALARLP